MMVYHLSAGRLIENVPRECRRKRLFDLNFVYIQFL